jgi:hypothetical protein
MYSYGWKLKTANKPDIEHKKQRRTLEEMKLGELEKKLDDEVSYFVRMTYADPTGKYVTCYTCGKPGLVKEMHAGHFISRVWRGTRWDLRNIRPQCVKCNSFEEGRKEIFEEKLLKEIGEKGIEELENLRDFYGHRKMPREWLISEIKRYRKINAKIRAEKGVKE